MMFVDFQYLIFMLLAIIVVDDLAALPDTRRFARWT